MQRKQIFQAGQNVIWAPCEEKCQKSKMEDSLRRSNCSSRYGRKLNGLPKGKALDWDGGIPANKIQELLAEDRRGQRTEDILCFVKEILGSGEMPKFIEEGDMAVLTHYQPICVLTIRIKIVAKIGFCRSQTRFVARRSILDNAVLGPMEGICST